MEKMSGVVLLNSQRIFRHSLLENAQVYTPSLFVFRNYIPGPAKPVITIPVEVERRAIKRHQKLKSITKDMDRDRLKNKPTLISCRRQELNHKAGQQYGTLDTVALATQGWKNRKSFGDYFSINPIMANKATSFTDKLGYTPTFNQLQLHPQLVEALNSCGFKKLTNIQHEALPAMLDHDTKVLHNLIAAETGNGKTLCFLVPVLQAIMDIKGQPDNRTDLKRPYNSPLSVIVAPSRELATQIGDVARQLGSLLGIKVHTALGGSIHSKLANYPREHVDIVVGSFGGLAKFFSQGLYSHKFVTEIVLDEIDTLLDDTFKEGIITFLRKFGTSAHSLSAGVRIIMTGATFPSNFDNYMGEVIDTQDIKKISTNQIHRLQFYTPQKFIRTSPSTKLETLKTILEKDVSKKKKVLIFSNKASTADYLKFYLNENHFKCLSFDQNVHWRNRAKHLHSFYHGEINILSATDLASRGLDTTLVDHVINYDFPLNAADYIHRSGRVGRVGGIGSGHVTSLVDNPLGIEVLQRMEYAVRKNIEIHNVNNNIIRLIQGRQKKKEEKTQQYD